MDWIIAKGNHHYSSGSTTLISPFTQADEVGTYQHYQETVNEINRLYNEGTISTYEREQMLEEAEFKRTHSLEQTRIQTQFQYERNKLQPALAYQEQGFLTDFNSIDIEVGIEDNTFQIGINKADSMKMGIELGDFLYCEGTEFGGIIDGRIMDTQEEEIIWTGTCFRGLIQNDIIRPLSGQNYRTVSGEANAVLRTLLSENNAAASFFSVSYKNSGCNISGYQFPRYCNKLSGIKRMLETYGYKLKIYVNSVQGGIFTVYAEAVPIQNLSAEVEFSQDDNRLNIKMVEDYSVPNHLICLGAGELAARTVVDLYVTKDGIITSTKPAAANGYFGLYERIEVYDYSSVEGETDAEKRASLVEAGVEKLRELYAVKSMELTVDEFNVDIGDLIAGRDRTTGFEMAKAITSKIVRVEADGTATIELSVDGKEDNDENIE